jgi:hypothetical protein
LKADHEKANLDQEQSTGHRQREAGDEDREGKNRENREIGNEDGEGAERPLLEVRPQRPSV